jgi:hypothetical protein
MTSTPITPASFFERVYNKFEERVPKKLKPLVEKIKPFAKDILTCLGIVLLGAMVGALVGVPGGALWIIVSASAGAAAGGLAFLAVKGILEFIKRFGFPAYSHRTCDPFSLEKALEVEKYPTFKKVILNKLKHKEGDQWKDHPWYAEWKTKLGFNNDASAETYLWNRMKKGFSHGESTAMVLAQQGQTPPKNGGEFLEQLNLEEIFYYQILAFIGEAGLKSSLSPPPSPLSSIRSRKTEPLIQDLKNETGFKTHLQSILNQNPKPSCAILQLDKNQTDKNQTHHSIFIQFKKSEWCFYDPSSPRFTGFHEKFQSEDEFLTVLYRHLQGYYSFARPCAPRFTKATIQWFYT